MGRFRRVVRIFVSSPGDLAVERMVVAGVAENLQKLPSMARRFAIQTLLWERDVPPVIGELAQLAIDRYMAQPKEVELFILLMGGRLGSPFTHPVTGISYPSGTEYELGLAYRSYRRSQRPLILIYRCGRPAGAPADAAESARVAAFFDSFSRSYDGIQPRQVPDKTTLPDVLYRDLGNLIERLVKVDGVRRWMRWTAAALIALLVGAVAYVRIREHLLKRAVRTIVDQGLADDNGTFEPEPLWSHATDQLVALGAPAVRLIVDALARADVYERAGRLDQTPTEALVRALKRDADSGALEAVCRGFASVLTLRPDAPRYPKSTHRIVIREGLARTACPGRTKTLCRYLGQVSSTAFTNHPPDWVDLRDVIAPLLPPELTADNCMKARP